MDSNSANNNGNRLTPSPDAQAAAQAWIKSLGVSMEGKSTQQLYTEVSAKVASINRSRDATEIVRRQQQAEEQAERKAEEQARERAAHQRKVKRMMSNQPEPFGEKFSTRFLITLLESPVPFGRVMQHCIGEAANVA